MDSLILLLQQETLTDPQWCHACNKLETLIENISVIIQNTCIAPPVQPFTQHTIQQGGYLPMKLQKEWKKHLSTYHLIRKAIYILQHILNSTTHPIILQLQNQPHIQIPLPPTDVQVHQGSIKQISKFTKNANKHARAITTKYTRK